MIKTQIAEKDKENMGLQGKGWRNNQKNYYPVRQNDQFVVEFAVPEPFNRF
jgi:hypothetical protein